MATYYVDGSVTSASGSGSGTLGDPWVKTDDLIQYAFDQIVAGAGAGSSGDTIVVLDGTLTNTAKLDLSAFNPSYPTGNNARPIWVKAVDPEVIIDWDCGASEFILYPYQAINFAGFRFHNFSNGASYTNYPFHLYRYTALINCIFDCAGSQHNTLLSLNTQCAIIGCKFINDNRAIVSGATNGGYIAVISSGVCKDNYFESTSNTANNYYSFGFSSTHIVNNVFYNETDYVNGNIVFTSGTRCSNNTFYSNTTTKVPCIYNPSSYENAHICDNNYFEGWSKGIYGSPNRMVLGWVTGNKGYNNTSLIDSTLVENNNTVYDFHDSYFKNETLSESGLVDAANKDFRPKSLLVAKGFNTQANALPVSALSLNPNVGAVNGVNPLKLTGQYNPFGGN